MEEAYKYRAFISYSHRDELASATSLGATLNAALRQSQFQIVICSTLPGPLELTLAVARPYL
jgi:hypothetical protein